MRKASIAVLTLGLVLMLVFVKAEEQKAVAAVGAAAEAVVPVEVGNKICPVSGDKVGQDGMEPYKMTHKEKVYNLCCGMCVKDFNKDPDKYTKIAKDEVKAAEAAAVQN